MLSTNWSVIETMRAGDDDAGFGPAAIWLESWRTSNNLCMTLGYDTSLHDMLLTHTTVKKFYHWIFLHQNLQCPRSSGTDGIEVDVEERFFILLPNISSYRLGELPGRADGVPGRNDRQDVVCLSNEVLVRIY